MFGLLSSAIPTPNDSTVMYISAPSDLVEGKISVTHKNHGPIKFRIGVSTNSVDSKYLYYNTILERGQTFESELIYFSKGQSIIVRSSDANTSFVLNGTSYEDTTQSGFLNQVTSTDNLKKILYAAPQDTNATVSVAMCNLGSVPTTVRLGISSSTALSNESNYLDYNYELDLNESHFRDGIKLSSGQTLFCSSGENSNVSFLVQGKVFSSSGGGGTGNDLRVFGNLRVDQKVGIGTVARQELDVIGNAVISGILTASHFVGNINAGSLSNSLQTLGTLPPMNGSQLTGVVATGSGVEIRKDGNAVGTAATLNFTSNLDVSFQSGIASIRLSNNLNIPGNINVNTNKFNVQGISGNTDIAGSLSVGSTVSFGSTINALNNKVINVGLATEATDGANKQYVDNRSILMAIALS